jgi:valyl-tRNA synthetase
MKSLPKQYDHQAREKHWQEQWGKSDVYHFRDDQPREQTFVIDTPPPTVSGVLHMGHIFSYTQADFVARYQRMSGKDVFYPMGFDDNGLPTERLVEKTKNVRGNSMPRADFVSLCREVVQDAENEFRTLFKSAALSIDWRQEYQTINDDVRQLSQASFVELFKKGEAYRDFRPTYWDWVDQTAIAQAEIENKEMPGVMNDIQFTLEDGSPIVIATTRPELLGACVAVMYHPEDPNAAIYKNKMAITPLFGVKVPMIADELVEREKGTGLVMCCTFGDDTDKEWWRKHGLPSRPILGMDGKIIFSDHASSVAFDNTGGKDGKADSSSIDAANCLNIQKTLNIFNAVLGLKPKQANARIIELLQAENKLVKQVQITHTVKCAERSGTPIEIIPTYQWFIRIIDKKDALLAKGQQCNWHPEYMRIRLNQWIEGLKEDWCISRQRFFGVPFPVWYSKRLGEEGKVLVADLDKLPIDPMVTLPKGYTSDEVIADKDIMDTWATSSISPQINAKSLQPNKLFPADLRPQAHEIIRTWAFYTIVKSYLHADVAPWKNLMISGWCLAADKTKMSKSKGNVVTPVALIQEKGSDAVRYWASTSRLGTDTAFSEDLLKIGRKLVTKLWNASNFASLNLSNIQDVPTTPLQDMQSGVIAETLDIWILSRLRQCIIKATQEFDKFEYCDARVAIEDFFWNDFCDNYLELVKARAYGEESGSEMQDAAKQQSALYTLYHCLETLLRLLAPFIPHITEELYSHIFDERFAQSRSVHARGMWPKAANYPYDAQSELSGMACIDVLNVIRKAKSEANVSIKFPVKLVEIQSKTADGPQWEHIQPVICDLLSAGNAKTIVETKSDDMIYVSEKGWFSLRIMLADAEVA